MVYLPTSQQWLQQSALLLEARPTTTRITTTYALPHPSRTTKRFKIPSNPPSSTTDSTAQHSPQPQLATLTLKTYDPVSGATLKYQTNKGAEVGRLVAALHKLARGMSTGEAVLVEETGADVVMGGTAGGAEGGNEGGRETPVPGPVEEKGMKGGGAAGANAGGGGKKKKGKGGKK